MKILALIIALLLCLPYAGAGAERYEDVFDTSGDAGMLTIRFLWLGDPVGTSKPGDSMILTSPDGKVMVLDSGARQAYPYLQKALETMGVSKIDYLVASHPHYDHISNFTQLMHDYEIGTLYTSSLNFAGNAEYESYMAMRKILRLEHVILAEGDTFMFGDDVLVEVFNPPAEISYPADYHPDTSTTFINDQSLVLKFTYESSTILLAGDLYVSGERAVLAKYRAQLDCDVMKANHHGCNTSSGIPWCNAVSPQITVMTNYTIDDLDVAKRIAQKGKLYHTEADGSVKISTAGDGAYETLTEKDRGITLLP